MSTRLSPPYETRISDEQWNILEPLFQQNLHLVGGLRAHPLRAIIDAISYQLRTGGAWRHLPHDFPPHDTVFYYVAKWRENGLWGIILQHLVVEDRKDQDRSETPTMGACDSQSTKSTEAGGPKGYDAGKKN
jgi:putative transposase